MRSLHFVFFVSFESFNFIFMKCVQTKIFSPNSFRHTFSSSSFTCLLQSLYTLRIQRFIKVLKSLLGRTLFGSLPMDWFRTCKTIVLTSYNKHNVTTSKLVTAESQLEGFLRLMGGETEDKSLLF